MEPPPPPPITIVDPNAPAGSLDVLGSDQRWQPSPYQRLVVVMTAVIVALLAGAVQEIRHVHHETALDAAAIRDVDFSVSVPGDYYTFDPPAITLTNVGRQPVWVTAVRLDGPGYGERQEHHHLVGGESTPLTVSSTTRCGPQLYTDQVTGLRVRARSSRGDDVERTVPLPPDFTDQLAFFERVRCGYLLPREALQTRLLDARLRGRAVVARIQAFNEGVLPITLGTLETYAGVAVSTPDLPLTLQRRAFWTGVSPSRTLTLTLRVTSCSQFASEVGTFDQFGGEFPTTIAVTARNDYRVDHDASLSLSTWDEGSDEPQTTVANLLRRTCPGPQR